MGLKAHHDDFKSFNFFRMAECGSLFKIEANVNLLV